MGSTEIILLAIVFLAGLIVAMDDSSWDRKKKD